LETAIELGHFHTPRNATCADIARKLDCTPKTVSEHLRKVQATVLTAIVP
jgi:predicted DNA binding protein